MRPSIFIVILLAATCCVSAAAPFSKSIETSNSAYAADSYEIPVPSPSHRQVPVTIEDRLLKIEKRQEEIMSQQTVISNRLDAIIDHVKESQDGH